MDAHALDSPPLLGMPLPATPCLWVSFSPCVWMPLCCLHLCLSVSESVCSPSLSRQLFLSVSFSLGICLSQSFFSFLSLGISLFLPLPSVSLPLCSLLVCSFSPFPSVSQRGPAGQTPEDRCSWTPPPQLHPLQGSHLKLGILGLLFLKTKWKKT